MVGTCWWLKYHFGGLKTCFRVQALAGIHPNPVNNGPALPHYFRLELREVANGIKHHCAATGSRRFSLPVWSPMVSTSPFTV